MVLWRQRQVIIFPGGVVLTDYRAFVHNLNGKGSADAGETLQLMHELMLVRERLGYSAVATFACWNCRERNSQLSRKMWEDSNSSQIILFP
ncbi:hypothetical protein PoB_001032800 [Plakobranchus ocellatus]|uniref:Uncharacterized protein n=1 Tax=Plakobranchus ocellatus TaxID=259542 RepID=A0AAV3YMP3_9GAST|nr:hypothetical protein PoB_001032800 [Plakobranchus ocellatus]